MIFWDPNRSVVPWNIPLLDRPLYWYGVFFALGILLAYSLFRKDLLKQKVLIQQLGGEKKAVVLIDRLTVYVAIGIVLGARLFDVLFYQDLSHYAEVPYKILYVWEGGLASHGGAMGAVLALLLFFTFHKQHRSWRWLFLDLLVVPAAIAAGFIRIGNFFNQEILGKVTDVPWAVVFGHPFDGGSILPRHPVQLYESCFYFLMALIFRRLKIGSGFSFCLFLIAVFSFRFGIEFFKEEQSAIWLNAHLTMGQILCLPFIVLGVLLAPFCKKRRRNSS